jgi:hypothetical protein
MLLMSTGTLTCLIVIMSSLPAVYAQTGALTVYVADFRSDDQIDSKLLTRMTDDFEFLLAESGKYNILERRRIGDLKDAIRNEANLRDDPQLVRRLRTEGVDAVLFGRVQDDVDDYALYASLIRLDSKLLWKRTSSLGRSLIDNRNHRLDALRKLISTAGQLNPPAELGYRIAVGPDFRLKVPSMWQEYPTLGLIAYATSDNWDASRGLVLGFRAGTWSGYATVDAIRRNFLDGSPEHQLLKQERDVNNRGSHHLVFKGPSFRGSDEIVHLHIYERRSGPFTFEYTVPVTLQSEWDQAYLTALRSLEFH